MDNVALVNIIISSIVIIIFIISLVNYAYAASLWLVLLPIVGDIRGFEGWEILPPGRVLITLLCGVALIKLRGNWRKISDTSIFVYYLLFLFALLLSALFSEMPLPSIGRVLTMAVPLMMGIIVLAAIMENENGLQMVLRAMIIGFAIAIAYALVEFILQKNYFIDLDILPYGEDYLSDIRFGISGRLSSFVGQPVYAALYFLTILPVVLLYRNYYAQNSTMKAIYAVLFVSGILVIFLTGTRSVYLSICILPFIYLFYGRGRKLFSSSIFYIYLIALMALPFVLPQDVIDFTIKSFQAVNPLNIGTTSGFYGRLELTEVFWDLFKEHMLLGFGPGYIQRMAASLAMFKHLGGMENQYAALLVESGVIGFLTFMAFILKVIKMSAATCRDENQFISDWAIMTSSIITLVMIIALSVYIVNGPIMNFLMMYLAIMIGIKAHCASFGADFENHDRELSFSDGNKSDTPLLQGE